MSSTDQKGFPLVSFCLCVFNQEDFIREAVEGALNQDYPNLEIIISDDCSTDRTWEIITEIIANHTEKNIILNRNRKNLGLSTHINKIYYQLTSGDYVALAAGDDISLPDRVSKTMDFLMKNNEVCAVSSNLRLIDSNSIEIKEKEYNNVIQNQIFDLDDYTSDDYQHINGASRTVSRSLINAFPPLNTDCPTEDTPFLLRAFMFGKVAQLKDYLVKYRTHGNNMSTDKNIYKMNFTKIHSQYKKDLKKAKELNFIKNSMFDSISKKLEAKRKERIKLKSKYKKALFRQKVVLIYDRFIGPGIRKILRPLIIPLNKILNAINRNVLLWWCDNSGNFNYGDELNPYLIEKLSNKKIKRKVNLWERFQFRGILIAIGSVINNANYNTIVWGAGIIDRNQNLRPSKYIAVRGPLTQNRLRECGITPPTTVGDPAILLPIYYKPKKLFSANIGFIPHINDLPNIDKSKYTKSIIIDFTKDIEKTTDAIASCKIIISSSLHGLIVANAYNIPAIWVSLSNSIIGDDVKYHDYFLSVGITEKQKKIKLNLDELNDDKLYEISKIANPILPKKKVITAMQNKLIKSFPF